MDQEKEIQELSEIEEIKHMLNGLIRTQEAILEKLDRLAGEVGRLRKDDRKKG